MSGTKTYRPARVESVLCVRELYSLHYFSYSRSFAFEGEAHPFWELICCGAVEAEVCDGDNAFLLGQGQAMLHAPDVFHNVRPARAGTEAIVTGFGGDLSALSPLAGQPLTLSPAARQWLKALLSCGRDLFSEPLNRVYQYELRLREGAPAGALQTLKNTLENLLISLVQGENAAPPDREHSETVRRIEALLAENIGGKLTLREVAYRLGYSASHLKKVFREQTGKGIIARFIEMKIARAKQYIAEGTHSFAEISELLGYDTPQYFSQQFRRVAGMSPSAYARSVGETGILG